MDVLGLHKGVWAKVIYLVRRAVATLHIPILLVISAIKSRLWICSKPLGNMYEAGDKNHR